MSVFRPSHAFVPLLLLACSGKTSTGAVASAGTEGGACYPNHTCNSGLACASNLARWRLIHPRGS